MDDQRIFSGSIDRKCFGGNSTRVPSEYKSRLSATWPRYYVHSSVSAKYENSSKTLRKLDVSFLRQKCRKMYLQVGHVRYSGTNPLVVGYLTTLYQREVQVKLSPTVP